MIYDAPLRDIRFVLDEAPKFAREMLAPFNRSGVRQDAAWHDGEVTTPDGFADAYACYVAGGWNALSCDPEYGGQGGAGIGRDFYMARIGTARFYAVLHGTAGATALNEAQFAA